jgi:hypothetical protein
MEKNPVKSINLIWVKEDPSEVFKIIEMTRERDCSREPWCFGELEA